MNVIQFIGLNSSVFYLALTAILISAEQLLIKKFEGKICGFIANYLPIATAFLATAVWTLCSGLPVFSENGFYCGIMAYSLGTVIAAALSKLLRGERANDATFILIGEILRDFCAESTDSAISEIAAILKPALKTDCVENEEKIKTLIAQAITKTTKGKLSTKQITAVAELILQSAKELKKEK